jgi:Bacterial regulatory proteins, gntR family
MQEPAMSTLLEFNEEPAALRMIGETSRSSYELLISALESYLAFWTEFVASFGTMVRTKLHEQARQGIQRLITERALTPGSKLPTESNLAGELYVSRTTIRNALNLLEQEGKIERTPGQGRIVRQPDVE